MRFLLDENLSDNVAAGLALAGLAVRHSTAIEELGRGAKDADIVRWCGSQDWVWVTADHDSRSREIRMALIPATAPEPSFSVGSLRASSST